MKEKMKIATKNFYLLCLNRPGLSVSAELYVPAAKTFPEFLAEVSEYPSLCLSSASSRAAASWTMNIRQPINIWALIVSVSTWRALTNKLTILGLKWLKFVRGTFLSVPGTSSLIGMLAKWSGRASNDCNKWIAHRLKSPRFIELQNYFK